MVDSGGRITPSENRSDILSLFLSKDRSEGRPKITGSLTLVSGALKSSGGLRPSLIMVWAVLLLRGGRATLIGCCMTLMVL
jgi:hypothetical protein